MCPHGNLDKPVVVPGGGVQMTRACDLRVMSLHNPVQATYRL
jgi:hypothetical protein